MRRFVEFNAACAPLVEYYSQADYHRIDGDREAELISRDLLKVSGGGVQTRVA
jgi:adenylate kinase family enzyme